jgi:rhomboid protease GluP
MHLLLNMWALFQTGHFVERLFGRAVFTAGYFGSGIVASFTSLFWHGDKIWSAGASGAVFGVYGLLLGFMLRERQSIPSPVLRPLLKSTLIFAGYNLFYGMIHPKIDNAAHIGGLVGGLAFGFLMALPVDAEIHKKSSSARLRLGLGVLAVFVAVAIPLSPRYDYNFRDELKWQEANRQSAEEEESLLKRQEKAVADLGKTANSSEQLVSLVEDTMIPFYENWRARLAALTLTPGKLTQTRREKLIRLLDAKLTNYRELASGLRRNDMSAVSHYAEAEDRAMAPLKAKPQ